MVENWLTVSRNQLWLRTWPHWVSALGSVLPWSINYWRLLGDLAFTFFIFWVWKEQKRSLSAPNLHCVGGVSGDQDWAEEDIIRVREDLVSKLQSWNTQFFLICFVSFLQWWQVSTWSSPKQGQQQSYLSVEKIFTSQTWHLHSFILCLLIIEPSIHHLSKPRRKWKVRGEGFQGRWRLREN